MPTGREDEERLTADIIELARQYSRYGYRKIAALLTPPLILIGLALTGRIITAASSSITNEMIPPMAIEAGLLAVLALGRLQLAR